MALVNCMPRFLANNFFVLNSVLNEKNVLKSIKFKQICIRELNTKNA